MTVMQLRWGLSTHVGQVRHANQDSAMANGVLFVVADGMGGHQGGEVASAIVAEHFVDIASVDTVDELAEAFDDANRTIREKASKDPNLSGMGTTVVALAVLSSETDDMKLACANVGDSRMYRLEDDRLVQMTLDHSLVAELARAGQITEKDAANHPQRNVLTRALGVDDDVAVDHWLFPAIVGHRYLLCSDGLVNEVSDEQIRDALREIDDPNAVAQHLVDMANAAGGRDNVTILVVDIVEAADGIECDPAETQN